MIINLFSSFDPITNFSINLNWIRTLLFIFFTPIIYWFIPSRLNILIIKVIRTLNKEFKLLIKQKRARLILISLLIFILYNNFLGLFPYIFTRSRHISITLSLALSIWLSFILYGWINHTNQIFTHLTPQGTPILLISFIVCIETVRNLIRPGTLAIRLSANIIAGHLLLTLLGNTGNLISLIILNSLILIQILLLVLEIAVAIIQAYVFATLTTLYSREV